MKVLITGNLGYVGSVLCGFLARECPGVELIGLDSGFFGHCVTEPTSYPERALKIQYFADVRDVKTNILEGVDALVHLAAISNDPMGNEFEGVTQDINELATINLARMAVKAGVKHFVFASSCSMYGAASGAAKREEDTLNPLTAYAKSKVNVEKVVAEMNLEKMAFTSLRFATACGWSPRLRLDLVLNDFVACAIASKKITVLSDGSPWRPLIDVEDMCRAIAWGISRRADVGGQFLAVNAGSKVGNFQVKDLARAVASVLEGTTISINSNALPDSRSYMVDFSLYERLAPEHQPQVTLHESITRIATGLSSIGFNNPEFRNSIYMRLNTLRLHLSAGALSNQLRWNS